MANISAIKLPSGNTYVLKDNGALQLTGGQVTGPVTFGDSVSIDEATIGDLVVNGSASFTNNISANTINGVEVGSSPKFTDTVTTISTSGSGNAITAISASNGVLTATKGATFLTSYTETDPVFSASAAAGITSSDISNWNNKSSLWTVSSGHQNSEYYWILSITQSSLWENDNAPSSTSGIRYIKLPVESGGTVYSDVQLQLPTTNGKLALVSQIPTIPTNVSTFTNDAGYLTSYTETDPIFSASAAAGISATDISNWNNKADIYDIGAGVGSSGNSSNLNINLSNYYGDYEYQNFMVFVNKSQNVGDPTIIRTTTNAIDNQLEIRGTHIILNGQSNPTIISPGLYYGTLSAWSNSATLTLTSAPTMVDIPQVYSSTNTGGYLTMATLPIYDGTVE